MSTKIYDGHLLKTSSLTKINAILAELRQSIQKEQQVLYQKAMAEEVCALLDLAHVESGEVAEKLFMKKAESLQIDPPYTGATIVFAVFDFIQKRIKRVEEAGADDPKVDFQCILSIFPVSRRFWQKGHTLCIPFAQQESFSNIIQAHPKVRYYGYWDNTDQDEECSEKEWKQREKDWKQVLPGLGVPSENGMEAKLHTAHMEVPSAQDLVSYFPERERRMERYAKEKTIERLVKQLAKEEGGEVSLPVYRMIQLVGEAEEMVRKREADELVSAFKKEFDEKVPPVYLAEDLKKGIRDVE